MLTKEEMAQVRSRTGIKFTQKGSSLSGSAGESNITVKVHDTGGMVRLTISYLGESVTQSGTVNRKFLVREVVRMTKKVLYLKRKKAMMLSGQHDLVLEAGIGEILGIKEWTVVWALIKAIVVIMVRSYDYHFHDKDKYGKDPKKVLELQDTGVHSQKEREAIFDMGVMSGKMRIIFLIRVLTVPAIIAAIALMVKYRRSLGEKFRNLLSKLKGAVGRTETGKILFEFFRSLSPSERKALVRISKSKPKA